MSEDESGRAVDVTVDGEIRYKIRMSDPATRDFDREVRAAFEFPNPDLRKRVPLGSRWNPPERVNVTEEREGWRVIPRGAVQRLRGCARRAGVALRWHSRVVTRSERGVPLVDLGIALRPYQVVAVQAMLAKVQCVLTLPAGGGKTAVGAAAIVASGEPALVLCPTREIRSQWVAALRLIGADHVYEIKGGRDAAALASVLRPREVVVALPHVFAQHKHDALLHAVGTLVVDECFPGETLVEMGDGSVKRIDQIVVGDEVVSYDERAGTCCVARVAASMVRLANEVVSVGVAGGCVEATPNHPFLTDRGWKGIGVLGCGDMVLSTTRQHRLDRGTDDQEVHPLRNRGRADESTTYMRSVSSSEDGGGRLCATTTRSVRVVWRRGVDSFQARERSSEQVRAVLLLRRARASVQTEGIVGDDESNQSWQIRAPFGANAEVQPDARSGSAREVQNDVASDGLGSEVSRRKWSAAAATSDGGGLGVGNRGGRCDGSKPASEIAALLQDRRGVARAVHCDRDRRNITLLSRRPRSGPTQGRVLAWTRVERASVSQRAGGGGPGRVRGIRVVYNLEVEGTHTYVIRPTGSKSGVVVHNCHHAASASLHSILSRCPARFRWGLTATAEREDGWGFLIPLLLGEVVVGATADDLVEQGYLVRPRVIPVAVPFAPRDEHYHLALRCDRCGLQREARPDQQVPMCTESVFLDRRNTDDSRKWRVCGGSFLPDTDDGEQVLGRLCYDLAVEAALSDPATVQSVARLAGWSLGDERITLALLPRVDACAPYVAALGAHGVLAAEVTGRSGSRDRKRRVGELVGRELPCLVATQIADEGLDVPSLDCLIVAFGGKAQWRAKQRIGRTARPEGKPPVVFDLVMGGGESRNQWNKRARAYTDEYGEGCLASRRPVTVEEALRLAVPQGIGSADAA